MSSQALNAKLTPLECQPATMPKLPMEAMSTRLLQELRLLPVWTRSIAIPRCGHLYTSGERSGSILVIESGIVKMLSHTSAGKDCLVELYAAGDIIGESSLWSDVRTETATALTHTTAVSIPAAQFNSVISRCGLLDNWIAYLSARIIRHQEAITLLVTADSEYRLAATLLRLSSLIGKYRGDHVEIVEKLSQEELSKMVGTTRSRIGFFLGKFRQMGMLELAPDGCLVLHRPGVAQYLRERGS